MVALVTERPHTPSQAAPRAEEGANLDQKHISEVAARETYQQELSAQRKHNAISSTKDTKEQSEPSTQFSDTIRERQSELREVVKNTNSLITGNERNIKNIENTVAQYDESWSKLNPWSSNFWVGGAIDGQRQELQGLNSLVSETKKHRDTLETALAKSELSLNEAQSLRDQGNVLATQAEMELVKADLLARENKHSESQLVRQEAEQLKLKSLEVLRDAQSKEVAAYAALPTEDQLRGIPEQAQAAYRESMKGVSAQYAQAIESLNTAESRVRMARDATVVIGVTVATGGVGSSAAVIAAYGTTGAAGAALLAGTAAGTAIGTAATVAEQGGAVAAGLKDGNHALADGLTQVGKDAQTSLVTSAAMVTGLGVAGKVAPKLGTVFTNQVAAKVATGMASGASGSVVSTTANEAIDVGLNGKEFNGQKFATDLGKNTLAGALGGGIGASGSMMRNGTAVRGSLVTGGEVLADGVVSVGIEGADSALSGREFSMAKAQEAFMQSVQGSVIGELGGKTHGMPITRDYLALIKDGKARQSVNPPPTGTNDTGGSQIYRIEDYSPQQSQAHSLESYSQAQQMRKAASAESMSENHDSFGANFRGVRGLEERPTVIKLNFEADSVKQGEGRPASSPDLPDPVRHPAALALDNPVIDKSVNRMLEDADHPMDLTRNLQHPKYGPLVRSKLDEISAIQGISQEEFVKVVADNREKVQALFPQDDTALNFTPSGESRMRLLREDMIKADPVLHSIGDSPELIPLQQERLRVHGDKIKVEVLPNLHAALEEVTQVVSPDSYVRVTSRAKSADGLHEKVTRMQSGNQGRGTRPEYRLADVPDAVGGRIVVEDVGDLAKITSVIEEKFQGNIFEKDNFYLNEKKSQRPYRVITYTVLQNGVPCEIQVMTLSSNISSDIDHNTVYKQLIGLDDAERRQVTDWWRGVVAEELNGL